MGHEKRWTSKFQEKQVEPQQSKFTRAKRSDQKQEKISEDFITNSKRDWGTRTDEWIVICVLRNVRKVGGRKKCSAITIHYGCLNFPAILIEGWLRDTTVVSPGVTHNQMFLSGTITNSCFLQRAECRNAQRTHQGISAL